MHALAPRTRSNIRRMGGLLRASRELTEEAHGNCDEALAAKVSSIQLQW